MIALSVAAVLAVFLLYTSIAGGGTPSIAPSELAGRTGNNRWVNFQGPEHLIHHFADVIITEARPNSLRGRLVVNADVAGASRLRAAG